MPLSQYRRKPVGRRKAEIVQAIQVKTPLRPLTYIFPRTRQHTKQSGALDYVRVIDAPEGRNRARLGDWIIKHADGSVEVIPEQEFADNYEQYTGAEAPEVGVPHPAGDKLDSTTQEQPPQ